MMETPLGAAVAMAVVLYRSLSGWEQTLQGSKDRQAQPSSLWGNDNPNH
ncbi:hypothetical protein PpBr36_07997 [Pyricularia pennisetigena]|nr:hypothetical protein PpBr36_07997 [Pyricularia pennisetigena]TLS24009.1 hypothetical protein PpBr36_07997 [Pyricularia pennisetigena]